MNRPLLDHLPAEDSERLPPETLSQSTVSEIAAWLVGQPLDAVEREMIRQTLEACNGDRALTASVLGISLPRLRKKLTAYAVRGEALDVPEPEGQARNVPPPPPAANDAGLTVVEDAPAAAPEVREAETDEAERFVIDIPITEIFTAEAVSIDPAAVDGIASSPAAEPEAVAPEAVESFIPEIPEPVAFAPEEIERPKLIAALPARPPRRTPGFGLFALLALGVVAVAIFGLRYLGTNEARIEAAVKQAPQLPSSFGEKQPFERRIPVPVWIAPPPLAASQPMSVDIAADRRAAPVAIAPQPRAISLPAGGLASANIALDAQMESASALASANIELDTRMDPPGLLASSNIEHDTRMESASALASANIELDTHMDAPAATLAAANASPEITGSVDADPPFVAPEYAPLPPARAEREAPPPARPVQRQAVRPQPAQPEVPQIAPFLFPFNLFMPREGREARGLVGEPVARPDCCGY